MKQQVLFHSPGCWNTHYMTVKESQFLMNRDSTKSNQRLPTPIGKDQYKLSKSKFDIWVPKLLDRGEQTERSNSSRRS
uniref:Uncharacterized protein n=1 Tax=Candidatus Kentrum sp. FW TaxID=2126338 RepID=A0A450T2C6_9GAMM|nr:MAG: hypothetical protein BECKFW1821A_GA0114235_106910 [Candidatus Kentron sp. FW]VFJ60486.1 MAG: hypothetical protein BECKFW1821B_GA0114236_105712 [Candidatus Kentron sp. FW]